MLKLRHTLILPGLIAEPYRHHATHTQALPKINRPYRRYELMIVGLGSPQQHDRYHGFIVVAGSARSFG
ncbi:hypothetical protein [Nocardia sp. NPDC046763]|uniref:hypothetical protein n=1 Tax=Nocardia sp. NPDC046763 TaxID=3155256 RepID=UPI0033CB2F2E